MKSESGVSSGSPVRSTFYGPNYGRNGKKDHYETPNPRRTYTIMSQDDIAQGKKSSWFELEITGTIRNLSPSLWQLSHLTSLYLNNNNLMRIPPDISRLENLSFLDLSYNKLRSLPAELGDLANLRELFLSHNYLRVLPYELGKLFQLQNLGLKGNPLSPEILSVYNEVNGTSRLLSYMLDNLNVTASQPTQRPWTTIAQPDRQRANLLFTCMSYNVLCDKYATRQIYGYCPSWALAWEYRKKGILDEIRQYAADVICLQEVETDQFYHFFLPELKQDGYDGVFSPKSRAKTMTVDERKHVDGCAIFFRASKFSLVKESLIEFNQIAIATADGTGSENMLNRVMTKDNIAISALLQTKDGAFDPSNMPDPSFARQSIMVCTAHIHWDPEFSDVKLIQTMMLMKELKTILEDNCKLQFRPGAKTSQIDVSKIPLILCADLNSLPDSGPLEYIQKGFIPLNHTDFKDMAYEHCLSKMSCSERTDVLAHPFKLKRSYNNDSMEYTNYTFEFKGVIDYIFHSQPHMRPLGVLGPVDPSWFRENRIAGCPHPHVPSDHFPLLVEFELMPLKSTSVPDVMAPVFCPKRSRSGSASLLWIPSTNRNGPVSEAKSQQKTNLLSLPVSTNSSLSNFPVFDNGIWE